MKVVALDIGDAWTGVAISDPMRIIARPYTTLKSSQLEDGIKKILDTEKVSCIVVGYPKTMRGTESEQTEKTIKKLEALRSQFDNVEWITWDERLSSKRADLCRFQKKSSYAKIESHARAAAFILSSYLEYLQHSAAAKTEIDKNGIY